MPHPRTKSEEEADGCLLMILDMVTVVRSAVAKVAVSEELFERRSVAECGVGQVEHRTLWEVF